MQRGVPFAIAWALRKPGDDVSTALTRGDAQRGTISLRQRSIQSRRRQRGSKTGERGFAICRSARDRRSRNVLEHRSSAKQITSPTDRRVRAKTLRCPTATLIESLSPNGNGSTQTSRNPGSERIRAAGPAAFRKHESAHGRLAQSDTSTKTRSAGLTIRCGFALQIPNDSDQVQPSSPRGAKRLKHSAGRAAHRGPRS